MFIYLYLAKKWELIYSFQKPKWMGYVITLKEKIIIKNNCNSCYFWK
jgi:hypothetical protein